MIEKECKNCGDVFSSYSSEKKKYCSRECWSEWCKKERIKVCKECGEEFEADKRKRKYCSRECSSLSQKRERIRKECPCCENEFKTINSYYGKKYCSVECANESFSYRFEGRDLHSDQHKKKRCRK